FPTTRISLRSPATARSTPRCPGSTSTMRARWPASSSSSASVECENPSERAEVVAAEALGERCHRRRAVGLQQALEQLAEHHLARQGEIEGFPAERQEIETELARRGPRAGRAVGLAARDQARGLALGVRNGGHAAVLRAQAAVGQRRLEEVARAGARLAHC